MNESSSGVPLDAERCSPPGAKCLEEPEHLKNKNKINGAQLLESPKLNPAPLTAATPSPSVDIASTCSMLRKDSSGTVTTAVYEAGDETTIVDGRTGTATVVEGAEVVRTVAVSYATPILHHVLLQGSPLIYSAVSTVPSSSLSSVCPQEVRATVEVSSDSTPDASERHPEDGNEKRRQNTSKEVASQSSEPESCPEGASKITSIPFWVITSQSVLSPSSSSCSPHTSSSGATAPSLASSSPSPKHSSAPEGKCCTLVSPLASCQGSNGVVPSPSCVVSPSTLRGFGAQNGAMVSCGARNDDELTSLSWLQDSTFLLGTALSPIKSVSHSTDGTCSNEKKSPFSRSSPPKSESATDKPQPDSRSTPEKLSCEPRKNGVPKDAKSVSPTSDFGDESLDFDEPGELVINDETPLSHSALPKPPSVPYNPLLHVKTKPPYSFSCLIFMAIEESQTKALPVKDIYSWILSHFPYYRSAPTGWKNSVRHNLSLNKCFRKVEKSPNLGKGSLWMVDPTYRPNLLQALSKIPLHPYSNVDRVYMIPNKAVLSPRSTYSKMAENCSPLPGLVLRREGYSQSPCSSSDSGNSDSADEPPSSRKDEKPLLKGLAPPLKEAVGRLNDAVGLVPNPNLFPLLAKRMEADLTNRHRSAHGGGGAPLDTRLAHKHMEEKKIASSGADLPSAPLRCKVESERGATLTNGQAADGASRGIKREVDFAGDAKDAMPTAFLGQPSIKVESEDVDAAAAMLILKHGPHILAANDKVSRRVSLLHPPCPQTPYSNKRKQKHSELVDPDMMLISSSPSIDHEYISPAERKSGPDGEAFKVREDQPPMRRTACVPNKMLPFSLTEDGSAVQDLKVDCCSDPQDKADALLNLASIATSLALGQIKQEGPSDAVDPLLLHGTAFDAQAPFPQTTPGSIGTPPKNGNKRKAFQPKRSPKRPKRVLENGLSSPKGRRGIPPSGLGGTGARNDKCESAMPKKRSATTNNNNNNNNNYVINKQYFSASLPGERANCGLKVKKVINFVEANS